MQNFAGIPPDPPEEIFVVFIFTECKSFNPHPYQMIAAQEAHANLPSQSVKIDDDKVKSQIAICNNDGVFLSCRGIGQRPSCLHFFQNFQPGSFFVVFIFAVTNQSSKIAKICPQRNFPLYSSKYFFGYKIRGYFE